MNTSISALIPLAADAHIAEGHCDAWNQY